MTVLTLARLQLSTWPWPLAVSHPYVKQRCPIEQPPLPPSPPRPAAGRFWEAARESREKQTGPIRASQAQRLAGGIHRFQNWSLEEREKYAGNKYLLLAMRKNAERSTLRQNGNRLLATMKEKMGLKHCQINGGNDSDSRYPSPSHVKIAWKNRWSPLSQGWQICRLR